MKSISQMSLIYLFIPIALLLTGCGDDDKNVIAQPTYEEQHFAADTSLRAKYPDSVKVNLEPKNGEAHQGDLHEIGSDCYKYQFNEPINITLLLHEDTQISQKTLARSDSEELIARATKGSNSEKYLLESNVDYTLCLESHEDSKAMQTLMIKFNDKKTKDARQVCPEVAPDTGCPSGCVVAYQSDKTYCAAPDNVDLITTLAIEGYI